MIREYIKLYLMIHPLNVLNRRVLELLSGDLTLSRQLRVPAISRMQKIHNVGVTFAALRKSGADVDSLKGNKLCRQSV